MRNSFWKTFLITLACFGGIYMLLVFSNRISQDIYCAVGWSCGFLAAVLLISVTRKGRNRFTANMLGIISGLLSWAFIGEFMEVKYGFVIAASSYLPVLAILVILFLAALRLKLIDDPPAFAAGHFLGIWGLHMWMIYQFEHLNRFHWSTYPSAAAALLLGVTALILGMENERFGRKMAFALATLLLFWMVLEYLWGWRLLPGPYSIG